MTSAISRPARVGLITDQTGALSFMGIANVNLAEMVTDDINARGGLLGRPVKYVADRMESFVSRSSTSTRSSTRVRKVIPLSSAPVRYPLSSSTRSSPG